MIGIIKFVIIFFAIYYGVKLLSRIVLPFLIQYLFKKTQKDMHQRFNAGQAPLEKEEGEVTINYDSSERSGKSRKDNDDGEYVDFEEVE